MMKKLLMLVLSLSLVLLVFNGTNIEVKASENTVVYFYDENCGECFALEQGTFYDDVAALGFTLIKYDIYGDPADYDLQAYNFDDDPNMSDLWAAFGRTYGVNERELSTPSIFVGGKAYIGVSAVTNAIESGEFEAAGANPLLEVNVKEAELFGSITGFLGFLTVLGAGLLDGFNPCAIALLLLFVSLLTANENKKTLLLISITYISALFVSYLLIGTSLYFVLQEYAAEAKLINDIISYVFIVVCLTLFGYNLYDYFVTKNEDYGKVKNQLPKWIQRFNKKIMKSFTNVINNPENKRNLFTIVVLTFTLGVVMSFTELLCTGQIYGAIIVGIYNLHNTYAYIALVGYNIMFVLPLIIIAIFSIRGNGAVVISNWIREHLHTIKLLNALLFLFIAVFFILKVTGVIYYEV